MFCFLKFLALALEIINFVIIGFITDLNLMIFDDSF